MMTRFTVTPSSTTTGFEEVSPENWETARLALANIIGSCQSANELHDRLVGSRQRAHDSVKVRDHHKAAIMEFLTYAAKHLVWATDDNTSIPQTTSPMQNISSEIWGKVKRELLSIINGAEQHTLKPNVQFEDGNSHQQFAHNNLSYAMRHQLWAQAEPQEEGRKMWSGAQKATTPEAAIAALKTSLAETYPGARPRDEEQQVMLMDENNSEKLYYVTIYYN